MIECKLIPMKKYGKHGGGDEKVKFGKYLNSIYHLKGFGRKKWIVGVNIALDYDEQQDKQLQEITEGCIEFLNTPPKSKYGKRRKRKPLYGAFEGEPYKFYLREQDSKKYIQALLVVEHRKSKFFWGEGEKVSLIK